MPGWSLYRSGFFLSKNARVHYENADALGDVFPHGFRCQLVCGAFLDPVWSEPQHAQPCLASLVQDIPIVLRRVVVILVVVKPF